VLVGYNNNTGSSGIGVVGSLVNWNNSTVDALIGLLELGYNSNAGGGTGAGTLQFNRGTLDITSARIGYKQDAGGGAAIGTLNIAGGTVNIRTLLLGEAALNGASVASLNLTGGTLTVSADLATTAVATSSVNIAGGTLDLGGGGVAHAIGAATATVDVVTFTAGTIRNLAEFNGGAGLVKSGAGVGTLDGSNSFTRRYHPAGRQRGRAAEPRQPTRAGLRPAHHRGRHQRAARQCQRQRHRTARAERAGLEQLVPVCRYAQPGFRDRHGHARVHRHRRRGLQRAGSRRCGWMTARARSA
jgi:hypothetical protein